MRGESTIPELPEVETVLRELAPISGQTIHAAQLIDAKPGPKYANLTRAVGQRIQTLTRRGKFLIASLDHDELIIHLGMTGVISLEAKDAKVQKTHLRVLLEMDNTLLHFQDIRRFGRFLVVPKGDYSSLPTLNTMGPEPLTEAFNPKDFSKALARSKTAIKSYLLSQKPVAGLGNIYVDEALWASKIHPLTPAHKVAKRQIPLLLVMIKDILEASIKAQGTTLKDYRTVNGEVGAYLNELKAYGQNGKPCTRCGSMIERLTIAGRSSHYCPQCQKARR